MRKCIHCDVEMVQDLSVMASSGGYGLDVREKGIFKGSLGKLKCAVCPQCGYTELYVEDTEKIRGLLEK